jgi:nucleotide-binding universal stress UspA family protein
MIKVFKKILFTTDMSKECRNSYFYAVNLAVACQGTITLLNVIQSPPINLEMQVKNLLGETSYDEIMREYEKDARSVLIGKRSERKIIESALSKFCENMMSGNPGCYLQPDEILVRKGEVAKEILLTAKEKESDLIILSSHKSILSGASVSKIIKGVLKLSSVPVIVVPPSNE